MLCCCRGNLGPELLTAAPVAVVDAVVTAAPAVVVCGEPPRMAEPQTNLQHSAAVAAVAVGALEDRLC